MNALLERVLHLDGLVDRLVPGMRSAWMSDVAFVEARDELAAHARGQRRRSPRTRAVRRRRR